MTTNVQQILDYLKRHSQKFGNEQAVKDLQTGLNILNKTNGNADAKIEIDGDYGVQTHACLEGACKTYTAQEIFKNIKRAAVSNAIFDTKNKKKINTESRVEQVYSNFDDNSGTSQTGFRNGKCIWTVMSAHPCEECEELDGEIFDSFEDVPDRPHPNCWCMIEMLEDDGDGSDTKPKKKPSLWEWLLVTVLQNIPISIASNNLKDGMQNFKHAIYDEHAIVLNSLNDAKIRYPELEDNLSKLNIPESSKGVAYTKDSKPSKAIANSDALKEYINEHYDELRNGEIQTDEIEFDKDKNPDLYYAFQHLTLWYPRIDEFGNFTAYIIDIYDFDLRDYTSIGTYLNDLGYDMQEFGVLENFFILMYINFKIDWIFRC